MSDIASRRQNRKPSGGVLLGVVAAAICTAGIASAQVTGSYQLTTSMGTFTELTDGVPVGLAGKTTTPVGKTIQLGFPMIFYGQTYTEVYVNSLGQVLFGGTSLAKRVVGSQMGDAAAPNGWVSPWFTNLNFATIEDHETSYKITGTPGSHIAVFQWKNWGELYNGGIDLGRQMQVILNEATRTIEIKYGPMLQTSSFNSVEYALAGAEDLSGGRPLNFLACNTNNSGGSRGCRASLSSSTTQNWPAVGTTVKMLWLTPEADLAPVVKVLAVRPTTVNGLASLEADLEVTIHNLGNTAANNVVFDIYSSVDGTIDPANDTRIGAYSTPLTVDARGTVVATTTVTLARPSGGSLYLGVEVDPGGAVNDSQRLNNRAAADPFTVGVDLISTSAAGPATGGLGDNVTIAAGVGNLGSDPVTATYGIYLSVDPTIDPATDVKVGEAQVTLNGFERKTLNIAGRIPENFYINAPELYWGVYADPSGQVTGELDRSNNGAASKNTWIIVLPDLTAENLQLSQTDFYFGELANITAEIQNIGDGDGHNVTVWIMLSDNPTITLSDHPIAQIDNVEVPKKGKTTITINGIRIPLYMQDGVTPYPTGDYSLGIIVDPLRLIPEASEANNGRPFLPEVFIRQPAPDFAALRVDGPPSASGGEVVPISRLIRNLGNRGNDLTGKAYRYQYFLSENEVISVQDRLLPLVVNGQDKTFGTGRLAVGGEDRQVDHVRLPENLPAGEYFLGLMVDATNEIDELDESNNVISSGALVRVIGTGLEISSTWLPDATERVGYLRQLVARGGTGSYTWRLVPGQGEPPKGITLSSDGVLAGAPERVGSSEFVVEVKSGNLSAMARLHLRVFTPSGALHIATEALPLAVEGRNYGATGAGTSGVPVVANGGVPPYRWTLLGNTTLPDGIVFSNGTLQGLPSAGTGGDYLLQVEVTDSAGGAARKELPLKVIRPSTLAFQTNVIAPDGVAGGTYTLALPLVGAQGTLKVAVSEGAIPEGLALSTGNDRVFLLGTPVRPGAWPFVLTATDDTGASASRSLVVVIAPRTLNVTSPNGVLPDAKPGEVYDTYLSTDATTKVTYRLAGGALPPGLALEESGAIRGTVPEGTPGRTWDFLVEGRDQAGGTGVAPFSIYVIPPPAETAKAPEGFGCSTGAGNVAPAGLMALAALFRRRSRRRQGRAEG